MIEIYHNPRCSKSRETLQLIEGEGVQPQIHEYMKEPPTAEELEAILKKLGLKAEQLLRKSEAVYKQYKGKRMGEKRWIAAMIKHPSLIQRPIVINGNEARLGRPPESVLEIIK